VTTLVVIQARTGSTRLPGKVLLDAAGAPLLVRMVERVRAARSRFALLVATTTDPADDPIADLCARAQIELFRGHPTDLLDRHVRAARLFQADRVVKIPSDCPLIDPEAIDLVLAAFHPGLDYCSNLHPQSWPDGNDVEVVSREALELAFREATRPHQREHTTPFLWDQPERFRLANVVRPDAPDLSRSHRLVLDYAEDYQLIREIYRRLWRSESKVFSLDEQLALLEAEPALRALNARWCGVNWYRHHLGELRTVGAADTRAP
jgi:spore coat polysaccharide biosynthesis protein SpsF